MQMSLATVPLTRNLGAFAVVVVESFSGFNLKATGLGILNSSYISSLPALLACTKKGMICFTGLPLTTFNSASISYDIVI